MTQVFCNPAGQRDNLGDSVLRRPYLDALRALGELHLLVGTDADYSSGLGVQDGDVVYSSRARWILGAGLAGVRRRLVFAANAGEYVGSPREWCRSAWQPVLALLARATGGTVLLAGASIRPGTSPAWTHLPLIARLASLATWRDADSRSRVGVGQVQPDWAFGLGEGGHGGEARETTVVVMRGDRPYPTPGWFDAVRAVSERAGTRLVVLVQVRRDLERAGALARELGDAVVQEWPVGADHATHEESVRGLYRTARFVISDRIHALIIGATEGAVPVAFSTTSTTKIDRTFASISDRRLTYVSDRLVSQDVPDQEIVMTAVRRAAGTVDEVRASIAALAAGAA